MREERELKQYVNRYLVRAVKGCIVRMGKGFHVSPQMYTQSHRGAGGSCV